MKLLFLDASVQKKISFHCLRRRERGEQRREKRRGERRKENRMDLGLIG
jgi:hypothetical protein